jgi:NAD(P)-dependent dehydrogenase (short-subunit alcohol dehydrogenase family)
MGRLDGKVALISSGIQEQGAAEARLFVQEGAKVVLGDILDEAGKHIQEEMRQQGGDVIYVHLDVTREADWQAAVETAVNTYGKLDILVNNAGMSGAMRHGQQIRLEDATEEAWDRVLEVNAKGAFLGIKYAIPAMRQTGGGSIVNISSMAGSCGPRSGAYGASRGAVRSLTKFTAYQYAKDAIRCNAVHPGLIATSMLASSRSDPGSGHDTFGTTLLDKTGTVDDIAHGVLFLASDESAFITGNELTIDGGATNS